MQIVDMVYFWARTAPLRPAVIEPEGVVTYAALARGIEAAAEHFARNIPDKSKPVAISLIRGSKTLIGVLGLLRAGFGVVLAYKSVLEHLASAGADTLVCERDAPKWSGGTNVVFDDGWIRYGTSAADGDAAIPYPRIKEGPIICFTSGSTGRPKPIVCPQKSWQQRVLFPLNSAYASYDRMLIVPGLITSWGLSRGYEALYAGRTICLAPTEEAMLWIANYYEVDTILASPQQALTLADKQARGTRYPLSSLKSLQIGASAIAPDGVARVQKYLCRNIILIYGSTEAGVVALAPYEMIADVPGAAGFLLPDVEVEIVDDTGRVMPAGAEGLVRVRTPVLAENVVAGVSGPEWFYPGDIGSIAENGLLCIYGRVTDVLNRGGDKFSITDFETFLGTCHGVVDAGVCTLMGKSGFEEAWVALVLDPSVNMEALGHAIQSNPTFGRNVDKLFAVEAIPRGALGKIQRDELKTMLQAIDSEQAA